MHPKALNEPVAVFLGYHEDDRAYFSALAKQLNPMVRQRFLVLQDGGRVPPGAKPALTIKEELSRAQVIVLLLSADFTAEDLWWDVMDLAVQATEKKERLVPVRVRDVYLDDTPLKDCHLLPPPSHRAIANLTPAERDKEWSEIARYIGDIVKKIQHGDAATVDIENTLKGVQAQKDIAYSLVYRGRGTDALGELRDALKKLDELSQKDSENVPLKRERAHLYDRIGQCEYAQGRFEAAREAFDQAFDIRIGLRDGLDDEEARHDIPTSRFWRAHLGFIRGDLALAREEQRAGMSECKELLAKNEGDLKAARALVVLQTDLGTTLWELGDQKKAEKHLRRALARVRQLAEQHPKNRQLQRDISVGLFRLADLLVARKKAKKAAGLCEESIRICRELSAWDPSNVQWRRHLATARISMGDARLSLGDTALARGDYEFAAGTMGALAAQERENLPGQRQYAISERKLGDLAFKAGDYREAVEAYRRAEAAMEPASKQGDSERWHRELDEIRNALSRAGEAAG